MTHARWCSPRHAACRRAARSAFAQTSVSGCPRAPNLPAFSSRRSPRTPNTRLARSGRCPATAARGRCRRRHRPCACASSAQRASRACSSSARVFAARRRSGMLVPLRRAGAVDANRVPSISIASAGESASLRIRLDEWRRSRHGRLRQRSTARPHASRNRHGRWRDAQLLPMPRQKKMGPELQVRPPLLLQEMGAVPIS